MNKAAGLKHFDSIAAVVGYIGPELVATLRDDLGRMEGEERKHYTNDDRKTMKAKISDIEAVIPNLHHLDDAEHATVLAALRFYQSHGQGDPANRRDDIHDIATNSDKVVSSLDDEGIDALCERLNTGG